MATYAIKLPDLVSTESFIHSSSSYFLWDFACFVFHKGVGSVENLRTNPNSHVKEYFNGINQIFLLLFSKQKIGRLHFCTGYLVNKDWCISLVLLNVLVNAVTIINRK